VDQLDNKSLKHRRYAMLAALLPACAAFCAQFFPSEAQSSGAVNKPPLAFHQYSVNLGFVEPRRDYFARFSFTNRGAESIEIRKLETSCGCLTDHLKQRIFKPGERGEFFLRVQSANQTPGPKHYLCKVLFGPVSKPEVQYATDLKFRIHLPKRSVSVSPRVLIFHQHTPTRTVHHVDVMDLRDQGLKVLNVSCDAPFVKTSLLNRLLLSDDDRQRGVIERVQIVVEDVPTGTHELVVRIATDDDEFNLIKVPLRIHGPSTEFSQPTKIPFEPARSPAK
jgi:hypothetical protein